MINKSQLSGFLLGVSYDDFDAMENKLMQARGIVNVVCDAYSSSEHEDMQSSLWAVGDLLKDALDILQRDHQIKEQYE